MAPGQKVYGNSLGDATPWLLLQNWLEGLALQSEYTSALLSLGLVLLWLI